MMSTIRGEMPWRRASASCAHHSNLAVERPSGGQDRQFANPAAQTRLVPQVMIERPCVSRQFGAVQQDAAWTPEAAQRSAAGIGEAVVDALRVGIEFLALRQGQPATGFGIDILGNHGLSFGRCRISTSRAKRRPALHGCALAPAAPDCLKSRHLGRNLAGSSPPDDLFPRRRGRA